jgi:hypothetical protein
MEFVMIRPNALLGAYIDNQWRHPKIATFNGKFIFLYNLQFLSQKGINQIQVFNEQLLF